MSVAAFDTQERRNWAGLAERYQQSYARVCAGAVPDLIAAVCIRPGLRVLDVGTGTGTVATAAAARGADVIAVDADASMIALAAGRVTGVTFHIDALPALAFRDGRFDAVLANFVINHVGDPLAALAELGRVATPGGHVAVTIWPQPPSPGVALLTRAIRDCGADRAVTRLAPQHEFARTEAGLGGLLDAAGLHGATCRSIDWRFVVDDPEDWWGIASGVSWMRDFSATHTRQLLDHVRRRFDQLSREFQTPGGALAVPMKALLATARA